MYVPKLTKPRGGEKLVDAFDFLQTKDVRLMLPENAQNRPKPHRVDVPADNSQNGTPNVGRELLRYTRERFNCAWTELNLRFTDAVS